MFDFIGVPFGWIMYWFFQLVKNYGVALVLFTLFTRLILVPLAVKQQKNTIRMQAFQPKLQKLQKKYANNKEKLNEETMKLYSEEGVNPMSSCLPLLIQMPIIFGLYNVINKPITHLLRISSSTIAKATTIITENKDKFEALKGVSERSIDVRAESYIIKAVQENSSMFSDLGSGFVDKVSNFDYTFLGLNMGDRPTFTSILILVPILSFVVNLAVTIYTQHKTKQMNPGPKPGGMGMNAMLYIMPVFSAVFAYTVPAGLGIYWILSSLFALIQTFVLYNIYTPERVQEIAEKEKQKKKKSNRKSMYERAMEAQAMKDGTYKKPVTTSSDDGEKKMSKAELKEYQRKVLNEARRRMAEKYGDEYDNGLDD